MLIERLKTLTVGSVSFRAYGGFTDRFLNGCAENGVSLKNVAVGPEGLTASAEPRSFPAICRVGEAAGMTVERTGAFGLLPLLKRYQKRVGIPIGLLLGAAIYLILGSMLWGIQISGVAPAKAESLNAYLSRSGVKTGAFLVNIDCNGIERALETRDPSVLRATVNLVGSKLYIRLEYRDPPPQSTTVNDCCNVIASKDGEVLSADILAGVGFVKKGDAVIKGDIIASGAVPLKHGGVCYVHAKALVRARTLTEVTLRRDAVMQAKRILNIRDRWSAFFFGITLPDRTDAQFVSSEYAATQGGVFPLGLKRGRYADVEEITVRLNQKQARLLLYTDLACTAYSDYEGIDIEELRASYAPGETAELRAVFVCREDIAEEQFFAPEE